MSATAIERLNAALEGRYAIERELGEGGMATVYLADDLKHERKVALKVLKPELAAVVGAERFLAEIKTTAHLQHPHILALHDSGEADSFLYYVMPYVDGESLQERLDREHQLPVGEAVHIATAVVNALDYAHRNNVIHRDIKPANILLQDGEPVVADFGIALAVGAAGRDRLTETGLSVGTPYYMSPEQATGDQHLGASSDTYSVACVLYEMLVGEPPYPGNTAQAVLGKIIQGLPVSATALRKSVPANVDAAIRRALEKLPADRFTEAQDFAKALADEGFRHGEVAATAAGEGVGRWKRMTVAFGTLAAVAMLAFGWALSRSQPGLVVRSSLTLAQGQELSSVGSQPIALSPDGSILVYSGQFQLWQRLLSQLENEPIPGTEQGRNPVVSPDGTSVAFTALGSLKTVSLLGGPPSTIVPSGVQLAGLDWASDGMLYFTSADSAIHRVPASGGEPEPVTANDAGTRHAWVDVLPDGRGLLFSIQRGPSEPSEMAVMGFDDDIIRPLPAGVNARYASSGHIVFAAADGSLLSAPFDLRGLTVTGRAIGLVDIVDTSGGNVSGFALSEAGGMVYVPQGGGATEVVPVWVERDGRVQEIDPVWRGLGNPTQSSLALSPDGTRLAISLGDLGGRYDLWVKQLDTGPLVRLTSEGTFNRRASWLDDRSLSFMSDRAGDFDLWTQRADGSSTAELVLDIDEQIYEARYSGDGAWLAFRVEADNIYAISTTGDALTDSSRIPLVVTAFEDRYVAISPNGRWLAYVSNETGREEVRVRPFPDAASALVPVSTAGGTEPVWSRDGGELFYRNAANEMVVAQVSEEPSFAVGRQEALFSMADYLAANGHRQYDVSPDGQRFVMLRIGDTDVGAELVLVQNFFEELRRLVPN